MPVKTKIVSSKDLMYKAAFQIGEKIAIESCIIKIPRAKILTEKEVADIFEVPIEKVLAIKELFEKG